MPGDSRGEPTSSQAESIFAAALRILGVLPSIISAVVSFAVIGYVVGWVEARAYFRVFHSEWLLPQLSAMDLLRFSWTPIFLLAMMLWVGLIDLAQVGDNKDHERFKINRFLLRYGWWILALLGGASYLLENYGYAFVAQALATITMFGYVFFAGAAFETIVLLVRSKQFVGDLGDASLVFGFVVAGLYFVPSLNGFIDGKNAVDPARSQLPVVETTRDREQELRLLLISEGTAFAAELVDNPKSGVRIHLLPINEIRVVTPQRRDQTGDVPK